jgi:hypothetical protein
LKKAPRINGGAFLFPENAWPPPHHSDTYTMSTAQSAPHARYSFIVSRPQHGQNTPRLRLNPQ